MRDMGSAMSCCVPGSAFIPATADAKGRAEELLLTSRLIGEDIRQTDLSVPSIHCGGCMQKIEKAVGALPGVETARVNLSTKRVTVRWRAGAEPPPLVETLDALGYEAHLYDVAAETRDGKLAELIRALAVAGFAASN